MTPIPTGVPFPALSLHYSDIALSFEPGGGAGTGMMMTMMMTMQKFLQNPSDERNHSWEFLLDRKLVAPGGGKNPGQAVYSAERRTPSPR